MGEKEYILSYVRLTVGDSTSEEVTPKQRPECQEGTPGPAPAGRTWQAW